MKNERWRVSSVYVSCEWQPWCTLRSSSLGLSSVFQATHFFSQLHTGHRAQLKSACCASPWVCDELAYPVSHPWHCLCGAAPLTCQQFVAQLYPTWLLPEEGLSGVLVSANKQEGLCPAPKLLLMENCLGSCVYPFTGSIYLAFALCLNDHTTSFIFPTAVSRILYVLWPKQLIAWLVWMFVLQIKGCYSFDETSAEQNLCFPLISMLCLYPLSLFSLGKKIKPTISEMWIFFFTALINLYIS